MIYEQILIRISQFLSSNKVPYHNIPLTETIDIAIVLILTENPTFTINRTELKQLFNMLLLRRIFYLTVSTTTKRTG